MRISYLKIKKIFYFLIIFLIISFHGVTQSNEKGIDHIVEEIHKKIITVDSHTDTPLNLMHRGFDFSEDHSSVQDGSKYDLPRMRKGGLDAAFFAVFIAQGPRTPEGYTRAKARADRIIDTIYSVLEKNYDQAELAVSPADAINLKRKGKKAVFLGMENGYPIGNDLSLIPFYYSKGIRYITLCHTRNNDICDSSTDTVEFNGLSDFGKHVVTYMNKTGMMIDVSHVSDQSFYDVLRISKAPVIASHSCSRAICDHKRNLDDQMLKALAGKGGVIQVCILNEYVKKVDPNPEKDSARAALRARYRNFESLPEAEQQKGYQEWREIDRKFPDHLATVADVADHIDHIIQVAGIDHVGIGTDFDGGGGISGCFDVSEMKNLTRELVKRGYSLRSIKKIWGGNLFRVMKKVKRISERLNPPCNC